MTIRRPIVRRRLAARIVCSLIALTVPFSAATAEYGIPAGSGGVITAGAPLAVRVAPGWEAEVSYEIADGSYVTVWGPEQAAADGSLWYPVDGGFVPVDAVSSVAAPDGGVALYQEAAPETVTEEWVDPAVQGWTDPATGAWVEPAPVSAGWVDPTTGAWVEPVAAAEEWVDPALGEGAPLSQDVDSTALASEGGDPAAAPVAEAPASDGWVDPVTGQWVEPAPVSDGWMDPVTGQWVEAAQTQEWVAPVAVESAVAVVTEPMPAEVVAEPALATVVSSGGPEPWGEPIALAYIAGSSGEGAVCRAGADAGAERLAVLGDGEAVEVRGEAVGEWQPVNCAGLGGYVNTSFIAWEPSAASTGYVELEQKGRNRNRDTNNNSNNNNNNNNNGNTGSVGVEGTTTTGDPTTTGAAPAPSAPTDGSGTGSATGQQIVDFALQFNGYPYVYAGEGPYAFDCSGLTKFVIQNTLGIDITHDMFVQYEMGQKVERSQLQPGDLVFFQNTFRPGMSHNGIYIGNGQMIHAENEQTGVKISDINAEYYSSRWLGAVRLT